MKSIHTFQGILIVATMMLFASSSARAQNPRVLVFSKTAAFYHESIPIGEKAIRTLGMEKGFDVGVTKDASVFSDDRLQNFDAVVFLNTTGDVLNEAQQSAFERYIRGGGGYVGVHSASDTEYEWAWYGQLVGAYFVNHPAIQEAKLDVVDPDHPATRDLPREWTRTDEWYNLRYVNDEVNVLVTLDESSYKQRDGEPRDGYHPHSWYHDFEGGRAFYTAMGHTDESYSEPDFLGHLWGGLQYAMGLTPGTSSDR